MILPILLLAIQTALTDVPDTRRVSVEIPTAWRPGACQPPEPGGDIVVCGKRDAAEQYRVRPLPEKYAPVAGPGLGLDLGKGARGNLYAARGGTIDGKVSQRMMVTVTIPF